VPNRAIPALIVVVLATITVSIIVLVALVMRHRLKARELLSRERLAAIEKGAEIPWESSTVRPARAGRTHLMVGLILLGAAFGLASATPFLGQDDRVALAWALFLAGLGIGNLVYDRLHGRAEAERSMRVADAMSQAYIRRLEGGGRTGHDADLGDRDAD